MLDLKSVFRRSTRGPAMPAPHSRCRLNCQCSRRRSWCPRRRRGLYPAPGRRRTSAEASWISCSCWCHATHGSFFFFPVLACFTSANGYASMSSWWLCSWMANGVWMNKNSVCLNPYKNGLLIMLNIPMAILRHPVFSCVPWLSSLIAEDSSPKQFIQTRPTQYPIMHCPRIIG